MLLLNQRWFKCESKDRLFYHSPTYIRPVMYIYLTITQDVKWENVFQSCTQPTPTKPSILMNEYPKIPCTTPRTSSRATEALN